MCIKTKQCAEGIFTRCKSATQHRRARKHLHCPNGDSRTYGADGKPEHDYDHNDHGRPDKHPHDSKGGHHHDWKNGVRGSAYTFSWGTVAGAALVTVAVIGIIVAEADDVTGIGVADDFLLGPLGAGIGEGLALILG